MIAEKECAIGGCRLPASSPPVIVHVPTMPAPIQIPLCALCREPFEHGLGALIELVEECSDRVAA